MTNDSQKKEKTMEKKERKEYTKEFKLSAVHLMKSGVLKPKEVFELLGGIDRQTVYRWISEYDREGESAFDSKAVVPGDALRRMQEEMKDLQMENEILKKAIAYFANRNQKR